MKRERLIRSLLPSACREHVLGDLSESAPSLPHLLITLLAVIGSQARRASPRVLLLGQGIGAYLGFAMFVLLFSADPAVPLIKAWAPALAALLLAWAAGAYRNAGVSAILGAAGGGLVSLWILPPRAAMFAAEMACAMMLLANLVAPSLEAPAPAIWPVSLDRLRASGLRFEAEVRRRNLAGYLVSVFLIICFGAFAVLFPNWVQRIGACLTVAGSVFLLCQLLRKVPRRRPDPAEDRAYFGYLKRELARQRDYHRGAWFCTRVAVFLPGPLLFNLGFARAFPRLWPFLIVESVLMLAFACLAIPMNFRTARRYQRQLDQVAAFEGSPELIPCEKN